MISTLGDTALPVGAGSLFNRAAKKHTAPSRQSPSSYSMASTSPDGPLQFSSSDIAGSIQRLGSAGSGRWAALGGLPAASSDPSSSACWDWDGILALFESRWFGTEVPGCGDWPGSRGCAAISANASSAQLGSNPHSRRNSNSSRKSSRLDESSASAAAGFSGAGSPRMLSTSPVLQAQAPRPGQPQPVLMAGRQEPQELRASSISMPESGAALLTPPAPNLPDTKPMPAAVKDSVPRQDGPMLGTWCTRQVRLLGPIEETNNHHSSHGHSHSQPGAIAAAGGAPGPMRATHSQENLQEQQAAAQQRLEQQQQALQEAGRRVSEAGSDGATEAAWRWRFARRWHAEQQRAMDPDQAGSLVDKTEEALQFLNAGGGAGWNMQVGATMARTMSTDASGMMFSVGTANGGMGSLLAGELLLEDGSYPTSSLLRGSSRGGAGAGCDMLAATREVNSLNRRAVALLEQQRECERQAEERWRAVAAAGAGDTWVGSSLATVEVDDWGTFKFLVLRLRGPRGDRQRVLVRGRNYCTEAQLVEDMNRQVLQLAATLGQPMDGALEVMGGGVMEWRRDRDRHVHLHSGFLAAGGMPGAAGKPGSAAELLNLAAVLTQQSLPVTHKVTIEGAQGM